MSNIKVGEYYVYKNKDEDDDDFDLYIIDSVSTDYVFLSGVSESTKQVKNHKYSIEVFFGGSGHAAKNWRKPTLNELRKYTTVFKNTITPKQKQSLLELIKSI